MGAVPVGLRHGRPMGGEPVHMRERYFLARVYGTATITRVHLEPSEQQGVIGHRWWSLAERGRPPTGEPRVPHG